MARDLFAIIAVLAGKKPEQRVMRTVDKDGRIWLGPLFANKRLSVEPQADGSVILRDANENRDSGSVRRDAS